MSDINISPINCAVWYGCHALAGRDGCVTPEACIRLNECAIRRCIAVGSCLADYSDYASLYRDTGCADCVVKHGKIVNPGCADAPHSTTCIGANGCKHRASGASDNDGSN